MENRHSRVALMECSKYDVERLIQKINEGIALIGGWERWVKEGMNVLLKVNAVSPVPSESAAVTHSEFVRAVTRILKRQGCGVWIGDSSGGALGGMARTGRCFTVSGVERVAQEEGAAIKNFDREGVFEAANPEGEILHLAKPLFEADFVINLPKMKTHMAGVFTGAVKNFYGCVPGLKKAEYHRLRPTMADLGEVLCDIHMACRPGLHIMDAVTAMDGFGPVAGRKYPAQKILVGTDALALDAVAAKMMGLDIRDVPIFQASIRRGLGEFDLKKIDICGDYQAPPVLKGFKLPTKIITGARNSNAMTIISRLMKTRPQINLKACKSCNMCVESCPMQVIDRETKKIDYERCIGCMCCHELCIHKAVKLVQVNPVVRALTVFRRKTD